MTMTKLKKHSTRVIVALVFCLSLGTLASPQIVSAAEFKSLEIDLALHQLRYGSQDRIAALQDGGEGLDDFNDGASFSEDRGSGSKSGRKSPFKAGLLSLIIPGLGQVYNGSHIGKAALFAGAEVTFLLSAKKFDNDANEIVGNFENFARANWNEEDYFRYLESVYGDTTDANDDLGGNHGHHLPSTETQQYFEMIGKYDQFSYGWARSEDFGPNDTLPWDTAGSVSQYEYAFGDRYPSPKRLAYNEMRANANNTFGDRDQMVIFAIVNHLVSSIDAVISANRHNKTLKGSSGGLSFHPSVRHDQNWALIPEVKLSLSF